MPRPAPQFHSFIGQKKSVDFLRRQLEGAQARNEPFPHALLLGPSGVGKTKLARTLGHESGTTIREGMGYDDRHALSDKLAALHQNDYLLIDEAHRLGHPEQELLCEAIDRSSIPPLDRSQPDARADDEGRIPLAPWTMILATDQPGRFLDALRKRVVIEVPLVYYPTGELKEIVEAMASEANLLISPQAARQVAEVAGGLPRRAGQLLQNLRLFYPNSEARQIGVPDVREFLDAAGFDEAGLDTLERRYLEALADPGSTSLETIALRLGTDRSFVRRQVEASLVRRGLVRIAPAGRQLTDAGRRGLDARRPADNQDGPGE